MKIKICGLQTIEDIEAVNEVKPDYIGFIFAVESKRRITFEQAEKMKNKLSEGIKSVGVFLNEKIENISFCAENNIIDMIQLHGKEDNNYINQLKEKTNLPVIKVFSADKELENNINKTTADFVLIDNEKGGSGKVCNWKLIPEKRSKRIFLAGGLNIYNIEEAIKTVKPYCVDINSGVETNEKKDKNKIKEITEKISVVRF